MVLYRVKIPVRSNALLASDSVIVGMAPNPKPLNAAWNFVTQGAMVFPDADRPDLAKAFEVQGWMPRIGLEKLKILVRERLYRFR